MSKRPSREQTPCKPKVCTRTQLDAREFWLDCVRAWYPRRHSKTYFLPPCHFNRVSCYETKVASQHVQVFQKAPDCPPTMMSSSSKTSPECEVTPVLDKDVRADRAQECVLRSLDTMATEQPEAMMVISQLQFGQYLNKPSYAGAVVRLPTIEGLSQKYTQGDFDVLIIHMKYGLITGEVKSVGSNFDKLKKTKDEEDAIVLKTLKETIEQLKKSEIVLKHFVSDLMGFENVTKIPIMPFISTAQLKRAIDKGPDSRQTLFKDMFSAVYDSESFVKMCLCEDQLSGDVKMMKCWWQKRFSSSTFSGRSMKNDLYDDLLSRFCGPATTVEIFCLQRPRLEIRTEGQGVSETGERMTSLVLLPEQLELLEDHSRRLIFLSGPPGTGKTILLILKGLSCLQNQYEVHVVSTWPKSRAASFMIEHQLRETMSTWSIDKKATVCRQDCEFQDKAGMRKTVEYFRRLSKVCILADEVCISELFPGFCKELTTVLPDLFLWAAAVQHAIRPNCLDDVRLTTPLRSPSTVVKEIMLAEEITERKSVERYKDSGIPSTSVGPEVKRIKHTKDLLGHTELSPYNCEECGSQIADILKELKVGKSIKDDACSIAGPPPLKYSDVLVLCDSPRDDQKVAGKLTSPAIGLVRGLRQRQVPVLVVENCDDVKVRDVALGLRDEVAVTNCDVVRGLERKIVVVVAGYYVTAKDVFSRLQGVSRCSAQLILIDWRQ